MTILKIKPFSIRTIPLALLLLCLTSFGLLIPWLGFYWDDWPLIMNARLGGGTGILELFQYDRPYSGWMYVLLMPILGIKPLTWHIFSLFLRWLAVLSMWFTLRKLWPGHDREITWMAFLFTVYPLFTQQSIAVIYAQIWLEYILFFASIFFMLQMIRQGKFFWWNLVFSIIALGLSLSISEYFLGLEMLRPLLIWYMWDKDQSKRKKLQRLLLLWMPYLAITCIYIIWRLFFIPLASENQNPPVLLYELAAQPISAIWNLFKVVLQDFTHILAGTWLQTIQPEQLELSRLFHYAALAVAVIGGLLAAYYLKWLQTPETESQIPENKWLRQVILIGFLAVLFGPLPVWIVGHKLVVGLYASRHGLIAMFGMSVLAIGLLEWLSPRKLPKIILIGVLIGLAINFHLRMTDQYRWSWEKQTHFYWQLYWRAPYIQPNTPILSDGEIFPYVGIFNTSAALNLLYPQPQDSATIPYWFVSLGHGLMDQIEELKAGLDLDTTFRNSSFKGNSRDSLVIFYEPEVGRCLWMLSLNDKDNDELPEITRAVLRISNLSRIKTKSPEAWTPPTNIFGPEPRHEWCYYYQKASLAYQVGDWNQVTALGLEAEQKGFRAYNAHEWLPFIEAFAHSAMWSDAKELTVHTNKLDHKIDKQLCSLWQKIATETLPSTEKEETLIYVRNRLKCSP